MQQQFLSSTTQQYQPQPQQQQQHHFLSTSNYAIPSHNTPMGAVPMYQYTPQDLQYLNTAQPFIDADRTGMGQQPIPQYDLEKIIHDNRHVLRMTDRQSQNATNTQRAFGYRTDPNTIAMGQISSREQVVKDYRSPYISLQPGMSNRPIVARMPTTTVNIAPIRR